jgi:anti-sigma B factor antagonist
MLKITFGKEGEIVLSGRFDASQEERARKVFEAIQVASVVDLQDLEYISSLGLGILIKTQKRLSRTGTGLTLVNVGRHVNEVFRLAGFHQVFTIRTTEP